MIGQDVLSSYCTKKQLEDGGNGVGEVQSFRTPPQRTRLEREKWLSSVLVVEAWALVMLVIVLRGSYPQAHCVLFYPGVKAPCMMHNAR